MRYLDFLPIPITANGAGEMKYIGTPKGNVLFSLKAIANASFSWLLSERNQLPNDIILVLV